jgi:hypothetical protein
MCFAGLTVLTESPARTSESRSVDDWWFIGPAETKPTSHNPFKVLAPFCSCALRHKHTGLCVHLSSG